MWAIYFHNNALKRDAIWGCDAETEEEAMEKFTRMHQPFCEIKLVKEGDYKLDAMRTMYWAKQAREGK